MTARGHQPVPGTNRLQQAIRVAGALAELGIHQLEDHTGSIVTPLPCRQTNLPGLLDRAPIGAEMRDPESTLRISVHRTGLMWKCDDDDTAARFSRALAQPAPGEQK